MSTRRTSRTLSSARPSLLAPDGKTTTIYLGMTVLVKNHAKGKTGDGTTLVADASPSFDITVVYQ